MAIKARMPRKKAAQVEVRHAVYGLGNLVERRPTENGADVLVVRFPDGETRTLLAAERYWLDLDLAAIPISAPPKIKDEPKKRPGAGSEEPEVEAVGVAADIFQMPVFSISGRG